MAVTNFSPLLGLALPTTGDLAGTWGTTVNDSITSLLDSAVAGTTTLSTDADVTLSTTNGASNQSRQSVLLCTGSRSVLRTITAPAQSKAYIVINATTGGYGVKVVGSGPTTGVTVNNGEKALIAWNGSDFVIVASSIIDLTSEVSGILPFGNGGTGQSSYTNGQLLIGNTATGGLSKSTITAGANITITNGNGSITIDASTSGDVLLASNNAFTGANTFYNNTGQTFGRATSTQDGIILAGRAGGSSSYRVTLTPTTLSASRTLTLPDVSTTVVGTDATQTLTNKVITSERETASSLTGTAIDLTLGNYFYKTISGNTTFTVSNAPASNTAQAFILELTNAGAYTITWFAGLTFPGGVAPTLTASGRDVLAFFTRDGGTTWSGFVVGKNLLGP